MPCESVDDLVKFLARHRARRGDAATLLAQGGGRYCIEDDEFPQLHRLMAAAAEDDFYVTLTYTLTQRCHFFCDLDFLVRAHTEAHARSLVSIEQACRLVARAIQQAVHDDDDGDASGFGTHFRLLALSVDRPTRKREGFKVGLHVHSRSLELTIDQLCEIRERAIVDEGWDLVVPEANRINAVADIYDIAPYSAGGEAGGLRMAYCRKRQEGEELGERRLRYGGGETVYRPRLILECGSNETAVEDASRLTMRQVLRESRIQVGGSAPAAPRRAFTTVPLSGLLEAELHELQRQLYAPLSSSAPQAPKRNGTRVTVPLKGTQCAIKRAPHTSRSSCYLVVDEAGWVTQRCHNTNCVGESAGGAWASTRAMEALGLLDARGRPLSLCLGSR